MIIFFATKILKEIQKLLDQWSMHHYQYLYNNEYYF